jgi:hypothetical protein
MNVLRIEIENLSPAGRRDLANALLRAAWSAVLEETRILLMGVLIDVDDTVLDGLA